MNLNKVQLIGRVTRDPELKSLPSGTKVCQLSVATNRYYTQDNEKKEEVEFHNLVSFGKTAEIITQYVRKGCLLYVEGRISTRSWDDKNTGDKKYRTEIIVENVQLPPKGSSSGSQSQDEQEEEVNARFEGRPVKKIEKKKSGLLPKEDGTVEYPEEDINPDDIPF